MIIDRIVLILAIIGGLNWGLVGLFRFDLVAYLFGEQTGVRTLFPYLFGSYSSAFFELFTKRFLLFARPSPFIHPILT